MDVHETLRDIPETFSNIHLSCQLAPFLMGIPKDIPGNFPMLVRAFIVEIELSGEEDVLSLFYIWKNAWNI